VGIGVYETVGRGVNESAGVTLIAGRVEIAGDGVARLSFD